MGIMVLVISWSLRVFAKLDILFNRWNNNGRLVCWHFGSLEMAFIIVYVIYSGVFILYGMCGKVFVAMWVDSFNLMWTLLSVWGRWLCYFCLYQAQTKLVYSYFNYRADQVLRQEWTSNVVIMEWRKRLQRYGILVYRQKDMTIIDDLMKLRDYTLYEDRECVNFSGLDLLLSEILVDSGAVTFGFTVDTKNVLLYYLGANFCNHSSLLVSVCNVGVFMCGTKLDSAEFYYVCNMFFSRTYIQWYSWSLYNITNTGTSYSFGQNGRMGFSLVLLMQWLHLVSLNQIQFSLGCTERNITKWYRGDWWLSLSEFLWSFMEWLQRMEYIWIGERGYHYTRSFGSPEYLKDYFLK